MAAIFVALMIGCLLPVGIMIRPRLFIPIWEALKDGIKGIFTAGAYLAVPARRTFDVDAARREAHDLGLPFVESDGTISRSDPFHLSTAQADVAEPAIASRVVGQFSLRLKSGTNVLVVVMERGAFVDIAPTDRRSLGVPMTQIEAAQLAQMLEDAGSSLRG